MRVVYSPAHLAHDTVTETVLGIRDPGERGRRAGRADPARRSRPTAASRSRVRSSTARSPILAVHDPGLVQVRGGGVAGGAGPVDRAAVPHRRHVPQRPDVRGHEPGVPGASRPETGYAGGRAGWWGLDTANPLVAGTYVASRAAVDVALTTVDLVLGGERAAYGLCRPPGHHAARSMAGGYCFFNNAAIAAEAIARSTGERVAILDVDYHHGNGTQQIFWRRGDVLYVSLHAHPDRQYPFFLGWPDETGEGEGSGANLNLPLPPGSTTTAYLVALDRGLEAIASTPGDVVVVSLGFDTYGNDPIGDFALTTAVYHECGRRVAALGRRLVILQEGGYHRPSLGANARAWLRGAEGREYEPLPAGGFGEDGSDR